MSQSQSVFKKLCEVLEGTVVSKNLRYLNYIVMVLLCTHFMYMAKVTWDQHLLHFNDYGFLNYVLSSTKNGLLMRAPYPEDHNHFSVHLHLFYFLALPFKWLTDSGAVLHFFHSFFLAAGVFPLYFIARKIGLNMWMTFGLTLFYFGNPYVLKNFMAFHYEPMVIPCILAVFAFKLHKRYYLAFLSLLLAFTVRDDYAFLIGATSLAFVILDRKDWKFWGVSVLSGLLWFFLARKSIMPLMYNPNGIHQNLVHEVWGQYGDGYGEIILYFLTHPLWIMKKIWESDLIEFLSYGLYIPLISKFSLGVLPPMAYISTYPMTKGELNFYSSAILIPFFMVGMAEGLLTIQNFFANRQIKLVGAVCAAVSLFFLVDQTKSFRSFHGFRACFFSQCKKVYPPNGRYVFVDKLIKEKINENHDSIAVSATLFPRISWRRNLYEARYWDRYKPCWVLLDMQGFTGNIGHQGREQARESLSHSSNYKIEADEWGYILFHNTGCA